LEEAREILVRKIHKGLTDKEKKFIVSVKKSKPEWELLGLRGIDLLPAVQWKLLNISRMGKVKQNAALKKLEKSLSHGEQV
jgi:hypothetical protein